MTKDKAKNVFYSVTFWFAVAQFVAGGLAALMAQYPEVGYLAMLKSIVDVVIRFRTVSPVKFI